MFLKGNQVPFFFPNHKWQKKTRQLGDHMLPIPPFSSWPEKLVGTEGSFIHNIPASKGGFGTLIPYFFGPASFRTSKICSGQFIATSAEVTLNGGLVRKCPPNPLNSGLGIILICPDLRLSSNQRLKIV